jgi:hypothetical protein
MDMTDYLANKIADHVAGTASFTMPTQVYLALFVTATGKDGSGTEMSGTGYARQAVDFDAAVGGVAVSDDAVAPTSTGQTATHWAYMDALTSGNMLLTGELSSPVTVPDGDPITIEPGDLRIEFA